VKVSQAPGGEELCEPHCLSTAGSPPPALLLAGLLFVVLAILYMLLVSTDELLHGLCSA
jgi:hypothetical protein